MTNRLFIHRFYQSNPKDISHIGCLCKSQRECEAVFKVIKIRKNSLYVAECIDIIPKEDYYVQQINAENKYEYHIEDKVLLRKHKKRLNPLDKTIYFYDPRNPGRLDSENFKEISIEYYNSLKNCKNNRK